MLFEISFFYRSINSYLIIDDITGSGGENRRFKIGKPWIPCLAENKKVWKEQAVRGMLSQLNLDIICKINYFFVKNF